MTAAAAQTAVVIAFSSRCGASETLAHAAAVGTVNARALPRLRRLLDDAAGDTPADCRAALQRMQKEYVPPSEADIAGSAALIVVPSAGMTPTSAAWQPFMVMLERLASLGRLAGKLGAVIDTGNDHTVAAFSSALAARGLTMIAGDSRDARSHGRLVGAAALSAAGRASSPSL